VKRERSKKNMLSSVETLTKRSKRVINSGPDIAPKKRSFLEIVSRKENIYFFFLSFGVWNTCSSK
jgi:hypothetical protein